ncbi:hypothetical protein [uncultured Clostridium sp.]|uniref:hypothetical protein n=1 Tax=uncultured Clostridium sp. TaxID=59620 RepID=UPI0028E8EABC|nr:hypothetical protein [uncultured Clostridium sp.]
MFGIIERPQFDLNIFKPGYPVILKSPKGVNKVYRIQKCNALVCEVNPLKITFSVVAQDPKDDNKPYCMDVEVSINQVLEEEYEILPIVGDDK